MGVTGHVHQNVAQGPVHDPWRHVLAVLFAVAGDFTQGDFQLVQLVVARLVNTWRLAGGANEHAREQVAERRMVVPVGNQAGQYFRLAQEGAVCGRGAAQHKVVATPRAGVATIGHEFFS